MADRQAVARVLGRWEQISATADALLIGELKRTGGTITVSSTTLALAATNLTLTTGDITGGSGSVLSGFDSIEGITSANLVDKTAVETITDQWTFQSDDDEASLVAKASGALSADGNIFEVQNAAGSVLFSIDKEGDMTVQGGETIVGSTTFQGDTTFGDAVTDTVTFTARMATGTDLIPIADSSSDLGTASLRFQTVYADTIGDSGQVLTLAGGLSVNGDAAHDFNLLDNTAGALVIEEGTNDYINIGTLDAGATIDFGNATTNPVFRR